MPRNAAAAHTKHSRGFSFLVESHQEPFLHDKHLLPFSQCLYVHATEYGQAAAVVVVVVVVVVEA